MKRVLSYTSVQELLNDRFLLEKSQGKGVTLAKFAAQFGMSGSMFKMILEGSRNLSIEKAHAIAKALRFSFEEEEYLETLLLSDKVAPSQVSYYQRRLQQIKKNAPTHRVTTSTNFLLSRWYLPALLVYFIDTIELQSTLLTEDQYAEVEKTFGLKCEQVDLTIREFQRIGFLKLKSGEKPHLFSINSQQKFLKKNSLKA